MGMIRTTLAVFAALALHYSDMDAGIRHAAYLSLGWWMAWAAYAAPRLSEIMRRVGAFIEDAT